MKESISVWSQQVNDCVIEHMNDKTDWLTNEHNMQTQQPWLNQEATLLSSLCLWQQCKNYRRSSWIYQDSGNTMTAMLIAVTLPNGQQHMKESKHSCRTNYRMQCRAQEQSHAATLSKDAHIAQMRLMPAYLTRARHHIVHCMCCDTKKRRQDTWSYTLLCR